MIGKPGHLLMCKEGTQGSRVGGGVVTFKSSKLEGSGPGLLACTVVLLLLFLSVLQEKKKSELTASSV